MRAVAVVRRRFLRLLEEHRAECLWFLREDYAPAEPEEMLRVLAYLERHGDRETFLEARRLATWLSPDSSGSSAGS
jgi:hypothetical protein